MIYPPIQRLPHSRSEHGLKPSFPGKPRLWACVALSALGLLGPVSAQAGFSGYYAATTPNWVYVPRGNSSWTYDSTLDSISLTTASNNGLQAKFTIPAEVTGDWKFNWQFSGFRANNSVGYTVGTANTVLTDSTHPATSGTITVANVLAGQTIGFWFTHNSGTNTATLTVYGLVAPGQTDAVPTPEPGSLSLFALGAWGLRRLGGKSGRCRVEKACA